MKHNPFVIDPPAPRGRMFGTRARESFYRNSCSVCGRCYEQDSWVGCLAQKHDALMPLHALIYVEPMMDAFARGGEKAPLLLCQFTGNA